MFEWNSFLFFQWMESVCENTTTADFKQSNFANFIPNVRSGGWSDIGSRQYMEDTHVCIADLAKSFGYPTMDKEVVSFYGVGTCSPFISFAHIDRGVNSILFPSV
jgi:hypothetical protein